VNGNFTYGYNNARNRVSMTDGKNNITYYKYDASNRLVRTLYPDETTRNNAYDGPGNLRSVTDQAGNVIEYTYDAANELQSIVQASSPDPSANTTVVGYDADGNPIALEDANSHTTSSSFDLANELTSTALPDGSLTERRGYDQAGNLQSVTHFKLVTTNYTYDTLNRLKSRTTPGEATVGFTYTATGKRASMIDASGTTNYSYDSMDRLTTKATPEGTLTYTYDAVGNLASISSNHTGGVSVSYTYDAMNRLSTVVDGLLSGSKTTTYTYDDASNLATATYPNTVQTTFGYDTLNRLTGLGSQVGNYSYVLAPNGNRTSSSEPNGRSVAWSYDGIYRLNNETIAGAPSGKNGTVQYGLDPVGNRLSESSSLSGVSSGSFSFNADDQLTSETYDQNGNVLTTGGKTFVYDSENHLVSMNNGAVQNVYDGDGNRVAKSVNGVVTYYLVDDLNPTGYPQVVEELSGGGSVERVYTYGVQRISENQVISSTWTPSFYVYDGMGSVRQLTNTAGTVTDSYEYDAFGNEISSTGSTPNVMLYRGEDYDSDLGLYYLRARWMNPLSGRFMSRDPNEPKLLDSHRVPVDPKELHKYLYAGGDPINGWDPSGRDESGYELLTFQTVNRIKLLQQISYAECVAYAIEQIGLWYYSEYPNWELEMIADDAVAEAKVHCAERLLGWPIP
jgi:RHS repeat-associated protein